MLGFSRPAGLGQISQIVAQMARRFWLTHRSLFLADKYFSPISEVGSYCLKERP